MIDTLEYTSSNMANLDPIQLHFMARQAADAYVSEGVSLNSTIAKMAEDNDLGDAHIKRIVEIANHQTNDALRKEADDKTFTFELADFPAVEALVNTAEPTTDLSKTAEVFLAVLAEEDDSVLDKLAEYEYVPASQSAANMTAVRTHLSALVKMAERDARIVESKFQVTRAALQDDLSKLGQVVKDFILQEGGDVDTLCKVAQLSYPDKAEQWGKVFTSISSDLKKLGHPFTGALADSAELSADYQGRYPHSLEGPDVTVINGASPVHGFLTPINQKISIVSSLRHWKNEFDSLASTLREGQQTIIDNDSVQPEVAKYTSMLFKTAQETGSTHFAASYAPKKDANETVKSYLKRSAEHAKTVATTPVPLA